MTIADRYRYYVTPTVGQNGPMSHSGVTMNLKLEVQPQEKCVRLALFQLLVAKILLVHKKWWQQTATVTAAVAYQRIKRNALERGAEVDALDMQSDSQ